MDAVVHSKSSFTSRIQNREQCAPYLRNHTLHAIPAHLLRGAWRDQRWRVHAVYSCSPRHFSGPARLSSRTTNFSEFTCVPLPFPPKNK